MHFLTHPLVFPEVVFYLTRLEVLMLQKNKLKTIPPHHDFPSTLHTLNLSFNQLTEIPVTLIERPPEALTHLHFSGNKLRNLPTKFLAVGYTKLVSLDFHTCQLSRCSPKFFERLSKCKDLRRLNLAINRLTEIPPELGLLDQLQWLNLNDNLLTRLPDTMSNLIHLVKLGLVQNQIEVLPPFVFLHMLELQKLDIRRNQLKYLPPSILALAPQQEVDIHVDLAVPHSVFHTLTTPICPANSKGQVREQTCLDYHPYGGSLRTLLFYENATIEHVDGILVDFSDDSTNLDSVQALSMANIYSILQSNPTQSKAALRQALMPNQTEKNILYCNHPKFRRSDNPMPNMLSEIDDEETDDALVAADDTVMRRETQRILTQVCSLRELTLRSHLTKTHHSLLKEQQLTVRHQRLDQTPEKAYLFIKSILPSTVVPTMIQLSTIQQARQCDFCAGWYTDTRLQIGYLARLCNNRLSIPIRFNICSTDCALDAVIQLHQSTNDWHTRQSLAHIESTLLLNAQQQPSVQHAEPIRRVSSGYWDVGLAQNSFRRLSREERESSPTDTTRSGLTAASAASSSTTLSTISALSCKTFLVFKH